MSTFTVDNTLDYLFYIYLVRFVNLICLSGLEYNELWSVVKMSKTEHTLNAIDIIPNLSCMKSVDRVIFVPHNMDIFINWYFQDELEKRTKSFSVRTQMRSYTNVDNLV